MSLDTPMGRASMEGASPRTSIDASYPPALLPTYSSQVCCWWACLGLWVLLALAAALLLRVGVQDGARPPSSATARGRQLKLSFSWQRGAEEPARRSPSRPRSSKPSTRAG